MTDNLREPDGHVCKGALRSREALLQSATEVRVATIRENVAHIARGCRASTSHNPAPYLNSIETALVGLLAAQERQAKYAKAEAALSRLRLLLSLMGGRR
jgi:hypothetical protein